MHDNRPLAIPLISATLVGLTIFWALPENLGFWRSLAIVSGWAGCGLLAASLLLMIREAKLAAWLGGLESMYRWHHRLGVSAYLILLIHPLALAASGWAESPALAWAMLAPWQQSWPVWLGWAALLCLMTGLALALSPAMPYARWRGLHNLLALAIVLALGHLLLLGLDYLLLWSPLLALAFILWRFLRADLGLAATPHVVARVEHPAPAVVEVHLQPLARPLAARPGQFVLAAFLDGPGFHGCGEYHPYTVSAVTPNGEIALGIKALGDCTSHLQAVVPGVAARIEGPFGDFLNERPAGPELWLAGGIGITPFLGLLRSGPLPDPVRLIYLHRNEHDAAFREELAALAKAQPRLALDVVACGDRLPDLATLLPAAPALAGHECYLCGPPGLLASAVRVLAQRGVRPAHIHFEHFDFR
ncbi:MAG: ferric reductase-like transmembrane domain-containing protein [Azonexus sp.]|nr:ferric reductase-like transmembrane domain-containing protein [Azonexus sp.]